MTEQSVAFGMMDVVLDHLDWAIRLCIDHRSYAPSITLAGAAEEVIGKQVGEDKASFYRLRAMLEKSGFSKKMANDLLNGTKTIFKHGGVGFGEQLSMDIETEALQYILRALCNLVVLRSFLPSEGIRFLRWLKTNRPDVYPKEMSSFLELTD